ncbi:alpha/beta fold hydrolase [Hymenobacter cellulosivorans]|uniref:Alpha/beta hydrolase n=1 Tax=Hymenobacter cellulosivorans TaxID=2932249 RepID=A0ABY4FBA3_9BACT|nr:alpha/beta hydrolase [Hymenobacter cellulosivorans]UOQ53773.1 alpha/beta hydrolase [Hymenobacter cellulosivorans]
MNVLRRNNVRVIGNGPRTLLFVNGFGCDQSIWRYLTPAFAEHFTLVLFDHVGAGLSVAAAYDAAKYSSLEGYAQDVLEICDHLGRDEIYLVGHSVGAMIGTLAAIAAPERFRKLLLLCPSPCYVNDAEYYGGFDRPDLEAMLAFMETDYVGWADTFAPFIMGTPDRPTLTAELTHSFCQTNPAIARQFARVTFLSDNRRDVGRLRIPCLLVQCAEDLVAPPEVGEFLLAAIPDATLVTLPVSGHCPQLSAPTQTLNALEAYLPGGRLWVN